MTFTPAEELAINEATEAWRRSYQRLTDPALKGSSRQKLTFDFPTADEIMRYHGIDWSDPRRYCAIEAEIRRRAMGS